MTMWDYIHLHPVYTFFLGIFVLTVLGLPIKLANRFIRHSNIKAKGWPPSHLDADGDWKSDSNDNASC